MDLRAQHGGKDNESPHLLQPTQFRGLLTGNLLKPDYYPTPIKAKEEDRPTGGSFQPQPSH